jgi:hypothetical protein
MLKISEPAPDRKSIQSLVDENLCQYYKEIGKIASILAMLEQRTDQLIWDLIHTEQRLGACLTSQLFGPSPRLRVIVSLLEERQWDRKLIKNIIKLREKVHSVQELRNRAVHDVLLVGFESKKVFKRTITARNKLDYSISEHSIEDLRTATSESLQVLEEFNEIQKQIREKNPLLSKSAKELLQYRHGPLDEGKIPIVSRDSSGKIEIL